MRSAPIATVFGCAAAIALSQACTSDAASSHAQRHLPAFARFERWARRVVAGDGDAREDGALSELLFAPVRNTSEIAGVFVALEGPPARVLALPARAVLGGVGEWVSLRDPGLGAIQAAALARCPIEGARAALDGPCVLITNRLGQSAQPLTITMAVRSEDP